MSAPATFADFATTRLMPTSADRTLATDVIVHLDAQIASTRSLLGVVLEQGAAIRARDVETVVRLAGILRGEMGRRQLLDEERTRLLTRSGERLGITPQSVTLAALCALMSAADAEAASVRSAELRGLLHELEREHTANRMLMQVELGFLDHLMGLLALDGVSGYDTNGSARAITRSRPQSGLHVLDLHA
jgi:FlgN protein